MQGQQLNSGAVHLQSRAGGGGSHGKLAIRKAPQYLIREGDRLSIVVSQVLPANLRVRKQLKLHVIGLTCSRFEELIHRD